MPSAKHGAFLTTIGCLAMVVLLAGFWLGYTIGTEDCRSIQEATADRQALQAVIAKGMR